MWIPLYVDKWIFGSTRIELGPAERGVFVDLLAFGAKDGGFIRANEITPYPHTQLAGLLNIPVELLKTTIAKCLHFDKLQEPAPGIYLLTNWENYQFSDRYIREVNKSGILVKPASSEKTEHSSAKSDAIRKDRIGKDKKEKDITASAPDKPDAVDKGQTPVNWENCRTDHQRLAAYYLKCYSPALYASATVTQATEFFKRQSRALVSICKQAGNITVAYRLLDIGAAYYAKRGLTWNLDTIASNIIEFIDKAKMEAENAGHLSE